MALSLDFPSCQICLILGSENHQFDNLMQFTARACMSDLVLLSDKKLVDRTPLLQLMDWVVGCTC